MRSVSTLPVRVAPAPPVRATPESCSRGRVAGLRPVCGVRRVRGRPPGRRHVPATPEPLRDESAGTGLAGPRPAAERRDRAVPRPIPPPARGAGRRHGGRRRRGRPHAIDAEFTGARSPGPGARGPVDHVFTTRGPGVTSPGGTGVAGATGNVRIVRDGTGRGESDALAEPVAPEGRGAAPTRASVTRPRTSPAAARPAGSSRGRGRRGRRRRTAATPPAARTAPGGRG